MLHTFRLCFVCKFGNYATHLSKSELQTLLVQSQNKIQVCDYGMTMYKSSRCINVQNAHQHKKTNIFPNYNIFKMKQTKRIVLDLWKWWSNGIKHKTLQKRKKHLIPSPDNGKVCHYLQKLHTFIAFSFISFPILQIFHLESQPASLTWSRNAKHSFLLKWILDFITKT